MNKIKKVLFISYYFPPAGGSAVQRNLKFAKYLSHFGWEPVILTAREKDYDLRDDSLYREIPPNIKIYRTPAPDLYRLYSRISKKKNSGSIDISSISVREGAEKNLVQRFALFIRSTLFVPDARIGWLPFAFQKARKIITKEKIDIVFTSSPPFTTALIGGLISRYLKIPWISDYRDPWTQAYFYFPRPKIVQKFEDSVEKYLLKEATRVVAINHRILKGLQDKYNLPLKKNTGVIPNGFDPEDFIDVKPVKEKKFTITYTGTQNSKMNGSFFLKAVEKLIREKPEFGDACRINFIGRIGNELLPVFKRPELNNVIRITDHLPHGECIRYTVGADLLLLLIPESRGNELIMTGKLFEYLKSGRPILCLSEKGDAADVIRDTGTGFTLPMNDIDGLKTRLWDSYLRWRQGKAILDKPVRNKKIQQYNRKELTENLAHIFNQVYDKLKVDEE